MGALLALPLAAQAGLTASPHNGDISLPDGFAAVVVSDGVDGVRGLAVAPNGDLYGRIKGGGIVALRDTDGDGVADVQETIKTGNGGSGVAVHGGYLYYSSGDAVYRMKRGEDELVPSGAIEPVVTGLPDKRQHNAKMFTFDSEGMLYVEVGSPSNALGNPDRARGAVGSSPAQIEAFLSEHGGIWKFDPSKAPQTQAQGEHWSTGHRHVLSLAWNPVSDQLFAAQNGRDVMDVVNPQVFSAAYNAEYVAEEFHVMPKGANLGWPSTYYSPIDHERLLSPEYGGDGKKTPEAGLFQDPLIAFPAHWAPMQMAYYGEGSFPAAYHGSLFLAFHGSWNRPSQKGYNVVNIPFDGTGNPTGEWSIFADDFMGKEEIRSPRDADFRPMGVAVGPDGTLYIGSDQGGRIWRVFYTGQ